MTTEHTFLFADLAGYTALTEVHGDEVAATVATDFCHELNAVLPEAAEDLKMLGDACLVRADDAAEAIAFALRLTTEVAPRHAFPLVRVGVNTGTAVRRGTEWFGAAINLASRVAALAEPGDVLVTSATLQAAAGISDVDFDDLGPHTLRNVSQPVVLHRARAQRTAGADWAVDPVCRMLVDLSRRPDGFCSPDCAARFATAPDRYAGA